MFCHMNESQLTEPSQKPKIDTRRYERTHVENRHKKAYVNSAWLILQAINQLAIPKDALCPRKLAI